MMYFFEMKFIFLMLSIDLGGVCWSKDIELLDLYFCYLEY